MTEENYNKLPTKVKEILDTFDDDKSKFAECSRIRKELFDIGWFCDYGLEGEISHVEKLLTVKNDTVLVIEYIEKQVDLYPQKSAATGAAFYGGYYVDGYMFAKGEEKERDAWLLRNGIFDQDTPNWKSLHEYCPENYYYSEWEVPGMDEAYDDAGNAYEWDDKKEMFVQHKK